MKTNCAIDFNADYAYNDHVDSDVVTLRNELYRRFNQQIGLLMESKRPRTFKSEKGKLDIRSLYKHKFSKQVFTQTSHTPKSDTTVIMLIDASGSMSNYMETMTGKRVSKLGVCNAVCSAFGKSITNVLQDDLKFEVFTKTHGGISADSLGVEGSFATLTRVLTNTNRKKDYDKILGLDTYCPYGYKQGDSEQEKFSTVGSYTPEYMVLPALTKWMSKNITTKNVIVINLTDGESYSPINQEITFTNENCREMRLRYLRPYPNFTMFIGGGNEQELKRIYGDDSFSADGDGFDRQMFKCLLNLLQGVY